MAEEFPLEQRVGHCAVFNLLEHFALRRAFADEVAGAAHGGAPLAPVRDSEPHGPGTRRFFRVKVTSP